MLQKLIAAMVTPTFARLFDASACSGNFSGEGPLLFIYCWSESGGGATQFLVTLFVKVKTKIAGGWAVDMEPLAHG